MRQSEELKNVWFDVAGRTMHVRIARQPVAGGPPVVLVHGIGVSSRYMNPTAVRLARLYPTYAPDLPGFGQSPKPDHILSLPELADALAAWMQAAGLESAVLIGNSFGCQIVVDLATRQPQRVLRAVLLGPTIDPQTRSAARQTLRLIHDALREPPSLGLIILGDYLTYGLRRLVLTFREALRDPIEEKLPRMSCPTLIVRGTRDALISPEWAEEATRLLPQGRLVVLPGVAHAANFTAPLEFVRVIRPFLDEERKGAAEHKWQPTEGAV